MGRRHSFLLAGPALLLSMFALSSGTATAAVAAGRPTVLRAARAALSVPPHDAGTGTDLPSSDTAFGKFAGESWQSGAPRSMSGRWNVPSIAGSSDVGFAGTWIGIEGPSTGDSDNGPFLQVGTNEIRGLNERGTKVDEYYAFFSDTDLGFSPVAIFPVRPGDAIRASLKLRNHRWTVWIRDMRSGRHQLFTTQQEGYGNFNRAEWIQEDATDGETQQALPYPTLSPVTFTHLEVNSVTPSTQSLLSSWMNELGQYLGPDPVGSDAFTLTPQRIGATGAQYLEIMVPLDAVAAWFQNESGDWTPSTPSAETDSERSGLAQALTEAASSLQAAGWPAQLQPSIAQIASEMQAQISYLQTTPVETAEGIRQWLTGLANLGLEGQYTDAVRNGLNLPDLFATPV